MVIRGTLSRPTKLQRRLSRADATLHGLGTMETSRRAFCFLTLIERPWNGRAALLTLRAGLTRSRLLISVGPAILSCILGSCLSPCWRSPESFDLCSFAQSRPGPGGLFRRVSGSGIQKGFARQSKTTIRRDGAPLFLLDPRYSLHGGFRWWSRKLYQVIHQLAAIWRVSLKSAREALAD